MAPWCGRHTCCCAWLSCCFKELTSFSSTAILVAAGVVSFTSYTSCSQGKAAVVSLSDTVFASPQRGEKLLVQQCQVLVTDLADPGSGSRACGRQVQLITGLLKVDAVNAKRLRVLAGLPAT